MLPDCIKGPHSVTVLKITTNATITVHFSNTISILVVTYGNRLHSVLYTVLYMNTEAVF